MQDLGEVEFLDVGRQVLVRGTLEKHMVKHKLDEESVLALEYDFVKAKGFKEQGEGMPAPDWIACVTRNGERGVLAGSFDGSVVQAECVKGGMQAGPKEEHVHAGKITAITTFAAQPGNVFVITASKDTTLAIRPWVEEGDMTGMLGQPVARCFVPGGSAQSLETVCAAKSSDEEHDVLLASAGWSTSVYLFQAPLSSTSPRYEHDAPAATTSSGKRRKNEFVVQNVTPLCAMTGHTDNVSACVWAQPIDPVTLFTASWDHTLRVWDCTRQVETAVLHGGKALTCLDYLASRQVLASGHPDNIIRMWDARASGDAVVKLSLKGHRGWVSSVAFQGEDSNLLATASYDRSIKIWDIRGGVPLHTIQTDVMGKLLAVSWGGVDNNDLFAGGADSTLRRYSME